MSSVYTPAEDSYLLEKWVIKLVRGVVLDMGTGSGIQAIAAAKKPEVESVLAVDIDQKVFEAAQIRAKDEKIIEKIEFKKSNLFSNVKGCYDWIIFNPPYLISEGGIRDPTWNGGESGLEVIRCFLEGAKDHLKHKGSILLVYSSETGLPCEYLTEYKVNQLDSIHLFFEEIYCISLRVSHA